jgi:O-antigen ligase
MMKIKNIDTWSILAIFLMLPFVLIAPGISWKSQQLFMLVATSIVVAFSLKNLWLRAFIVYLFCWTIYLFLRSLISPGIHFNVAPQTGMSILLYVLSGAVIVKFVSISKLSDEKFYHVIIIAVLLQVFMAIIQYLGFYPWEWLLSHFIVTAQTTADVGPFRGTLGNRDILGCFLGVSIPMFLSWTAVKQYQNILIKALTVLVIAILLFSPSPGTVAALIGMGVYYFQKNKFSLLIAFMAAAIYAIIYILTSYHLADFMAAPAQLKGLINTGTVAAPDGGRLWKWMLAFSQIIQSPETFIFGSGPGAFWGKKYPLHNEYIQCWFEIGLVGLVLMLGYVMSTFNYLIKSKNMVLLSAFTIVCIDAGANYPLHIATTAFLICIIAGLIERQQIQKED